MSFFPGPKISIGAAVIAIGCGAVLLIVHENSGPNTASLKLSISSILPPTITHSAAWYVAHPDVLKADEQRCAGDAATMTPASCQNVASADAKMASADYAQAAAFQSAPANSVRNQKP